MRSSTLFLALACVVTCALVSSSVQGAAAGDKVAKYNARVGANFIAAKAKEEGVTLLDSGVAYKVITAGDAKGKKPGPNDQVKVHYAGTLITGKEFDSSYSRGEPATFGVGGVIRGWTEILQLMTEGSTWEVYIPADKAYGASGSGKLIGPNATLVFKVELLEVLGGAGGGSRRPPPPKKGGRKAGKPKAKTLSKEEL